MLKCVKVCYKAGDNIGVNTLKGAWKMKLEIDWKGIKKENKTMMIINGHEIKPGADLRNADLRCDNLSGLDLSGADLRHADLRGANLVWADLRKADLSGANLRDTYLSGADFTGANITGADFTGWEFVKELCAYCQQQTTSETNPKAQFLDLCDDCFKKLNMTAESEIIGYGKGE